MLVVDIERMPSYNLGLKRGFQEGKAEGREEAKMEDAKKKIMIGLDIETIHKITELSIDKIKKLREKEVQ